MRTCFTIFLFTVFVFMAGCNTQIEYENGSYMQNSDVKPPVAKIKAHERHIHGDTVTDNYYWMIDYFKKGPDSTEVLNYLKEENTYLDTIMSGSKTFREKLYEEMKRRIKEKDESVPVFKNGYFYYIRTEDGKQ